MDVIKVKSVEDNIGVGSKVWVPDVSSDRCKIVKATVLSFEIIFSAENLLKPQYKVRVKINDSNIEQSNIFDEIALTKKEATKKYYISFANSMLHSRKYFLEQKRRLQGELDITDEILSSYIKEIMRCLKHLRKSNIEIKKIMAVGALE